MTSKFMSYVDTADFKNLFIEELGWDQPTAKPLIVDLEGNTFHVTPVAGFSGLHVWACASLPDRSTQAQIDREVSATSTERLIIFHDSAKQEWRWPRYNKNRGTNMSKLLVHEHVVGHDHSALEQRLQKIALDIDHEITLVQLLERMRTAFDVEESEESSKAAKVMAKLYYELESHLAQNGPDTEENLHKISVTMARILFLVFADDTMMWDEENLFQNFVAFETARDGSDLTVRLEQLFTVLNTDKKNRPQLSGRLERFKYVNGGIFAEDIMLPDLGIGMRELLLEACRFDWGNISPAIFGSMFQAVKSKELRRELGAHYTSERDILKTLKPLFLDELHAEFERTKKLTNPTIPLNALRHRLGEIKILDPACGCGNFLIVAYRELRELELQIMESLQEYRGDQGTRTLDATLDLHVKLTQIYGIEIDEWPARIAETALHLIDRQCNLRLIEKFGEAPERLPISEAANIVSTTKGDPNGGNALRMNWCDVFPPGPENIIVGNPPFIGGRMRDSSQTADLKKVWGKKYSGNFDYVTGWYKLAIEYGKETNTRIAFVSTNSICQGFQVEPLWSEIYSAGYSISFAHRTFGWASEASGKANVHVIIVGLAKDAPRTERRLFWYPTLNGLPLEEKVSNINPYLLPGTDVLVSTLTTPLSPDLPMVRYGNMPRDGGYLVIEQDEYEDFMADPIARKYVRPYIGARELLRAEPRWCLWLVDMTHTDMTRSPLLKQRVEGVRNFRLKSTESTTVDAARFPHLFVHRSQSATEYLCIPRTASASRPYFPAERKSADFIASDAVFIADDPDGFMLGIISSKHFIIWQKTVGGRLKSDIRFSGKVSWNTFPLPPISADQRNKIIETSSRISNVRMKLGLSLSSLYSSEGLHPTLLAAHLDNDLVVGEIFGHDAAALDEAGIQASLFAAYTRLTRDSLLPS